MFQGIVYAACPFHCGDHGGLTLQNSSVRGSFGRAVPVWVSERSSTRLQVSTRSRPTLTPPERIRPALSRAFTSKSTPS